jgi:hypothetical protein
MADAYNHFKKLIKIENFGYIIHIKLKIIFESILIKKNIVKLFNFL